MSNKDAVAIIGEIAHIVPHSDLGPRGDPSFPQAQRDKYENLILLCPTHHDIVDVQPNTYSKAQLLDWKMDHEKRVRSRLAGELPRIGFAELEIVTQMILGLPFRAEQSLTVVPPADKIVRNSLTGVVGGLITMGLSRAREVSKFIQHMAMLDPDFPDRLRAGFVTEYTRLRHVGLEGDSLFEALRDFASSGSRDFPRQAAGLAVLSHLFEICDVFES